jgi:hypothetical protein
MAMLQMDKIGSLNLEVLTKKWHLPSGGALVAKGDICFFIGRSV